MFFDAPGQRCAGSVGFLFPMFVLVLCLSALGCAGQAVPSGESPSPPSSPAAAEVTLRTLITGAYQDVHRYAESVVGTGAIRSTAESAVLFLNSVVGQENVHTTGMFVEMAIRFLAEGAASGLNVIAVYVTEILRVTGIDVKLPFPRFTPEGVASVAQWGLLALIGYWVLTVLLRLLIGTVRRVFWLLKAVLTLWLFALIVSDSSAAADVIAVRLAGLVLGNVLLGLASSGSESTAAVENRLSSLEGRLKAVEKRNGDE